MGCDAEMAHAYARRGTAFSYTAAKPHPARHGKRQGGVHRHLLSDGAAALQRFGGKRLTKEFPLEKMLRDARAMSIEDGENTILVTHFGDLLTQMQHSLWSQPPSSRHHVMSPYKPLGKEVRIQSERHSTGLLTR